MGFVDFSIFASHASACDDYIVEHTARGVDLCHQSVFQGVHVISEGPARCIPSEKYQRQTAVVWMAEGGVPMSRISQFLGHTNTKIIESVYARFSPDFLRHAAVALNI